MRRLRVVLGALAVLLLVIGGRYFLLPRADSVAAADYLLDGPTRFTFPYETGTPVADCRAAPLLGFFSTTLHCTLSYPSGDVYHCKVFTTAAVGPGARCDTQPVRPYQCEVFTTTATVGAGAFCDTLPLRRSRDN